MYDYLNDEYESLQNLLHDEFIDEVNWLFAESFELPIWLEEVSYL